MSKSTWWCDDAEPARRVRVEVTREERDETGIYHREQVARADAADWYMRGGAHYLRFELTDPESGTPVASTLRIRPDEVALIRSGDQAWHQVFRPGVVTMSRLRTASLLLSMEVTTHRLDVRVTPRGGSVRITFTQTVAGHPQQVRLWVRFAEANDVAEGAEDDGAKAIPTNYPAPRET